MATEGLLNALLLLDNESRKVLKVNLSDFINYNIKIIYDLDDLDSNVVDEYDKIILLDGLMRVPNSINEVILIKRLFRKKLYFLSDNKYNLKFMSEYAKVFRIDISLLDIDKVSSVLLGDEELLNDVQVEPKDLTDGLDGVVEKILTAGTYDDDCVKLAKVVVGQQETIEHLTTSVEYYKDNIDRLVARLNATEGVRDVVLDAYKELMELSRRHNDNLSQYEVILSKNVYAPVSVSDYTNRPLILYIKEYEELIHFNSFINTIYSAVTKQLHSTCKILRLFDDTVAKKITVFKGCKVIRNSFKEEDVISNDFIVKYGNYEKVLDILLDRVQALDVLVIIDSKSFDDTVTIGHDIRLNMCRNEKHVELLGLDPNITIVNNATDEYNDMYPGITWDTLDSYDDLYPEDRELTLTSQEVIGNILSRIEDGGVN